MADIKIFTLTVLCAVLATTLGQQSQGGPHGAQGGPHGPQGGPHEMQGITWKLQKGPHESYGGPHESQGGSQESQESSEESQGDVRQLAIQEKVLEEIQVNSVNFTSCDITTTPILSCADCNTRLICRPVVGGLLISCSNPYRPYCANGICSPVPSADCA